MKVAAVTDAYQLTRRDAADKTAAGAPSFDDTLTAGQPPETPTDYDFSNMTRQEIADAGKQLFQQGKITLDELFRFDHPDGRLRVALDGTPTGLSGNDRIDFISETRNAISAMEQTGESSRAQSPYALMVGLLAKLQRY